MIFRKYRPEYIFYMELGDPAKNQKFPMTENKGIQAPSF
jgi:hypothetical protein